MELIYAISVTALLLFLLSVARTIRKDREDHKRFMKELRRSGFLPPYEPGATRREY